MSMIKQFSYDFIKKISLFFFMINLGCNNGDRIIHFKDTDGMAYSLKTNAIYVLRKQPSYFRNDIIGITRKNVPHDETVTSFYRILGITNDTIEFKNGDPYVNDILFEMPSTSKRNYLYVNKTHVNASEIFSSYEINYIENDSIFLNLSVIEADQIRNTLHLEISKYYFPKVVDNDFYIKFNKNWNRDNFGKIIIPNHLRVSDSVNVSLPEDVKIEDVLHDSLYFVIGDDLQKTTDSRYIGFVPKSLVLGKLIELNTIIKKTQIK